MKATHTQNLVVRVLAAALCAGAISRAAAAQNLHVTVGQNLKTVLATLAARGIAYQQSAAGEDRSVAYSQGTESIQLGFSPWPTDPAAPASAWEPGSKAPKELTLVRIRDSAPSSEPRRAWVNSLAREGRGWAYLKPEEDAARPAPDRTKYPVAAGLEWGKPPAKLVFQAARAAGTPPSDEPTELVIELLRPHRP